MKPLTVLIDRDGVINRNRIDYVKSWEEFEFLPGSLSALKQLAEQRAQVIVVTNQSVVGRGIISLEELELIHARMREEIEQRGAYIDAVFCCPHTPDDGCSCRKPQPGMLAEALELFEIDRQRCYVVGDSYNDLLAAQAMGLPFILVLTGRGREELAYQSGRSPSLVASDLRTAVRWILKREGLLGEAA
jgi:D-glycero-D-manno-heptose 1,7-bisphosphate phosphatase